MSARIVAALTAPGVWDQANAELIAKLVAELAFEDVLVPEIEGERLTVTIGQLTLRATCRRRTFGDVTVDPASVTASIEGAPVPPPPAAELVALGAPFVGADPSTSAGLVAEVSATLVADAVALHRGRSAQALLDAPEQEVEGELRGHPWIVASKGRIGFAADDLDAYTPEAGRTVMLEWLAVDPERVEVRTVPGLDPGRLAEEQLGPEEAARLRARAGERFLMPVHPWQWRERIAVLHADDIARGRIVHLGAAAPRYRPRQSLRTLADAGHPFRRELKLSLGILNTSVYRGLPRARALAAPALTDWLTGVVTRDPFLQESGLVLLGEVAAASVAHPGFEAISEVPYQHTELLGAIWREPAAAHLRAGERALPLAALLHRDRAGTSLVELLIARSGLDAAAWVRTLHDATLPPLAHILYRHGVTFSPHGQNCLVVLAGDVPIRLVVKDFVDDATIVSEPLPELADLPEGVRAALGDGVEPAVITQWIHAGLLVGVHRYLAALLEDRCGLPEARFWDAARAALTGYQDRFAAELAPRYDLFDLDAPVFVKLCLNRVRILERGYSDAAERPIAAAVGFLDNPLAAP